MPPGTLQPSLKLLSSVLGNEPSIISLSDARLTVSKCKGPTARHDRVKGTWRLLQLQEQTLPREASLASSGLNNGQARTVSGPPQTMRPRP